MTHGTDVKLINFLHAENANLPHKDLITSIEQPENWWNIHLVLYDTFTSRAKPSSNGQLSHCSWSCVIFDESHWYRRKNSVGWQIVIIVRIGFKLHVTAMRGFHSLYDWCYQRIWLFSCACDDPEDDAVMETHGGDARYTAVKSLLHAVRTEDLDTKQDAAHRMIHIAKPWTIRRWSDSKLANRKPLVWILMENAHLFDLEWTEDEQAELNTLLARYTSLGASGAWRVLRWWLACCSLVLRDTEDWNDISG